MATNKPVCDLNDEECNKQFIDGISVIENSNSMHKPKIGDKKFSNESTASDIEKAGEKVLQKKKLNFNEIPS